MNPGSAIISPTGSPAAESEEPQRRTLLRRIRQFGLRIAHYAAVRKAEALTPAVRPTADAMRLAARIATSAQPQSIITFTGLDSKDEAGTIAFQSALALTYLSTNDILLVKQDVIKLPVQDSSDEDRRPIEVEDLHEIFHLNRYSQLYILSSWRMTSHAGQGPLSLLRVLKDVRRHFHMTIVECPPLLKSPSTSLIVSRSEGVVLVLDETRHTVTQLQAAKNELQSLNAPLLGAVLAKPAARRRFHPRRR
jgi:hypothetical protein